ncbi:hypothetical protein [Flavobacterium oreochromis]|uniref:Uncharacterized protein n=1 Tax=Flavobacterium oreochromis TaxID=2906078 RepID=A0ABW8PE47_9FLAO|nr:hypothetical protein [Flavobacterium oreochromis]
MKTIDIHMISSQKNLQLGPQEVRIECIEDFDLEVMDVKKYTY